MLFRSLSLGHPPPLLQRGGTTGPVEFAHHSPPLNLAGLITGAHEVEEVPFGPGERLLLFTDGITEARNARGGFYPLAQRFRDWRHVPSEEFLPRLRGDLGAHAGGAARDDMTAILIARRHGAATDPFNAPARDRGEWAVGKAPRARSSAG